jgi:hypothetical protein
MRITTYKCDLCKKDSKDMSIFYSPKSGASVSLLSILRDKFTCEDICVNCFEKFEDGVADVIHRLNIVDKL